MSQVMTILEAASIARDKARNVYMDTNGPDEALARDRFQTLDARLEQIRRYWEACVTPKRGKRGVS